MEVTFFTKIKDDINLDLIGSKNRFGYLDGWRGIAIALVLISHFIQDPGAYGRMGVDVFFVLSGLLMANILFVKRMPLGKFYKRRFSRIFPVFFIYLSLVSFVSYMWDLSREHENFLYHLFFLRTFFPSDSFIWAAGIPVEHLWSLAVEEHAYLILSVLTIFLKKRTHIAFVLFMVGVLSIATHYYYIYSHLPDRYLIRTEANLSFIFLSAAYFLTKDKFTRFIPQWLPVFTFLLALFFYSPYAHWAFKFILAPFVLAFTVNHLDGLSFFVKQILCLGYLRLLGIWSFSIYLWQQPLYFYISKPGVYLFDGIGVTFFTVSIFLGALSFYLLENPIRGYLNNNW